MKPALSIVLLLVTALAVSTASSLAESSAGRIVYYTSYKCPPPTDATTLGSSPETAINLEEFDQPIRDELSARDDQSGKTTARFDCKWVRLRGFFSPTGYYHYRGRLYEDAWAHYRQAPGSYNYYLVESFKEPSMRRSAIGHRRVTLVGQFYYLCSTGPGGDDVILLLGPCHYGGASGMMLADVTIEKVEDASPVYLAGERNRQVVGRLPPVQSEKRAMLADRVRAWAAAVQRGPKDYAADLLANDPVLASFQDAERRSVSDDIVSADSYVSYLSSLPAFRRLNTRRSQVSVFWDGADATGSSDRAVGCICLKTSCANEWPLTASDAESFYGAAACTLLVEHDGKWLWR